MSEYVGPPCGLVDMKESGNALWKLESRIGFLQCSGFPQGMLTREGGFIVKV